MSLEKLKAEVCKNFGLAAAASHLPESPAVVRIQQTQYGGQVIGVDLHNPDFVSLAHSFGMRGLRAETPDALRRAMREAFAGPGPALIEIPVGELPSIWGLIWRPPSPGVTAV